MRSELARNAQNTFLNTQKQLKYTFKGVPFYACFSVTRLAPQWDAGCECVRSQTTAKRQLTQSRN